MNSSFLNVFANRLPYGGVLSLSFSITMPIRRWQAINIRAYLLKEEVLLGESSGTI